MNTYLLPLTLLLIAPLTMADEPIKRHGVIDDDQPNIQVEGGFTATYQQASDDRIHDEATGSFDLLASFPNGMGHWSIYIEGNLSPRENGVSTMLGEANADAGTALDQDAKGRLQVSELHYAMSFDKSHLTLGLIDPSCTLDASDVANDETSQFIGASFVNNPTIAFPDYALGGCFHYKETANRPGLNIVLTSSHGLADNPNASYSELVDLDAEGKGHFAVAELYWTTTISRWHIGIWSNNARHEYLDGSGQTGHNRGAYLSTDHYFGETKLNLRIGAANNEVSAAARFAALALETPLLGQALGIGFAHTNVSDKLKTASGSGIDDTQQAEAYIRFAPANNWHITPSIQQIQNSGFDDSAMHYDRDIVIYSLRSSYQF